MSGNLRFDTSGFNIGRLIPAAEEASPRAVGLAMEHILGVADELTPIETGRLVGSGTVHVDGDTASITYDGPYARFQHERLDLRHEHGQAKYLEQPLHTEKDAALGIAARVIKDAL